MKVAYFLATILEQGGGTQEYFITTSKKLADIYGHDVDVICLEDRFTVDFLRYFLSLFYFKKVPREHFYNEELESIRMRMSPVRYIKCSSMGELRKQLAQYDIILSKNELLEAIILKLFIGFKNIGPVIFSCHTGIRFKNLYTLQAKLRNQLYNGRVYKYLCRDVTGFHVLNSADKNLLLELFPGKPVYMIYPPFNFDAFIQRASDNVYEFDVDASRFNIISIGRISVSKGVDELVNIINDVNSAGFTNKVTWHVVGTGEDSQLIKDLTQKWSNVVFHSYIENKYLPSMLARMNLYISLSKLETFGFTIVEANTMNVPALTYKLDGPNELIDSAHNGYLAADYVAFKKALMEFIRGERSYKEPKGFMQSRLNEPCIYKHLHEMIVQISKRPVLRKPKIFAIIGSDGVGKSTVAKALCERLQQLGYSAVIDKRFEEYFVIRHILRILKGKSRKLAQEFVFVKGKKISPLIRIFSPYVVYLDQLFLYFSVKHFGSRRITITDRYPFGFFITWRYYNFSNFLIQQLYMLFPKPDALYVLSVAPEEAFERKTTQNPGRVPPYELPYFEEHTKEYAALAESLDRVPIDTSQSLSSVVDLIIEDLRKNGQIK